MSITPPAITLAELFEAYFACRKNKRNTHNAMTFEVDYEERLVELWNEINQGSYHPGRSIAFIVEKPVKREIFAAAFKDRIVHHLIFKKINPLFEKTFIYDSYACRTGKGASLGVKRIAHFIRKCSINYTRDCYILKLDVQSFFMGIDKNILFDKLTTFLHAYYHHADKDLLLNLCEKIIYCNPTQECIMNSHLSRWRNLPKDKSLFYGKENCGLPIGNLTSQVLANFYMNSFDHFIKHDLGIRYYGRYVDDFILIHPDKDYLKSLIPCVSQFLQNELKLTLHPKKIYLQHFKQGAKFLGVVIKPHRNYISNRIKGNFFDAFDKYCNMATTGSSSEDSASFLSSMNSYLGMMKHYSTYRIRKKIILKKAPVFRGVAYVNRELTKFVLKKILKQR